MLRFGLLPEGEIIRSPLVALAVQCPGPFEGVVQGTAGKDTVVVVPVVFLNVEIYRSVGDVCISCIEYPLYGLDLLDDVA